MGEENKISESEWNKYFYLDFYGKILPASVPEIEVLSFDWSSKLDISGICQKFIVMKNIWYTDSREPWLSFIVLWRTLQFISLPGRALLGE